MNNYHWIKFWIETLDDAKIGRLSDNLWRRFFECCLLAGELGMNGRLPEMENISWRLRVDEQTLISDFEQLSRYGLLDYNGINPLDAYWFVVNFEKRQSKLSGAARVAAFREREKKREYYEVGNELVTTRYTEEEEEEEKEEEEETPSEFSRLSAIVSNAIGLPEFTPNPRSWTEAIKTLNKINATEQDIINSVRALRSSKKDYTIIGAQSIVNAVINQKGIREWNEHNKKEENAKVRPL